MEPIWHVVKASVQGTSHKKKDVPCQDAHGYQVLTGGVALIAVADGAGSADRSDEGAQLAVKQVIGSAEAALAEGIPQDEAKWQVLMTEAFRQARQAIAKLAEAEDTPLRVFATTLTFVIAGDEWLVAGQIGDGVAVAEGKDGELFALTRPQHGEYANETFFLTMDQALEQVEIQIYPHPVPALAVMTDGLIRLAMNVTNNEPHPPFFRPLFDFTSEIEDEAEADQQLAAFLASNRVCARTDDDKTLVLAVRLSESEVSQETEALYAKSQEVPP